MAKPPIDPDAYEIAGLPRRRSKAWLAWLLLVLLATAAGAFVWYVHLPAVRKRDALTAALNTAAKEKLKLEAAAQHARTELDALKLSREKLSGELALTVAEKQKIEAELKRVQDELSGKLEPEIQSGAVRIRRRGSELVVDVADQVLFDTGAADVSEGGAKVLAQVAPTLAKLTGYTIQVGGHTDSAKVVNPATQQRFPTNWELSTARATNVVRYLQERGRVPGERLCAAGFSQFRPVLSNVTPDGRKKNRRIEVVLVKATPAE
jgi:chemotaxis protein MotB